jgi:hypothetical protein
MTKMAKLIRKMEHLYMWYEIMMPLQDARTYGEEYYWYARYI